MVGASKGQTIGLSRDAIDKRTVNLGEYEIAALKYMGEKIGTIVMQNFTAWRLGP